MFSQVEGWFLATTRDGGRRPVPSLGVIGTTYGHLFQSTGHDVEHLVRRGSPKTNVRSLHVDILDGRFDPRGTAWSSVYTVKERTGADYDLVFISVPSGEIASAAHDLVAWRAYDLDCPALLLCGVKGHAGDVKAFNRKWAEGEEIPFVWVPNAGNNSNVDAPVS